MGKKTPQVLEIRNNEVAWIIFIVQQNECFSFRNFNRLYLLPCMSLWKAPFSRFFSLLLSLFNQKCYELSQGPGIEPKDACEIGILLFKTWFLFPKESMVPLWYLSWRLDQLLVNKYQLWLPRISRYFDILRDGTLHEFLVQAPGKYCQVSYMDGL